MNKQNLKQPLKLKKTLVLVGMMGAGKTTVGAALARALNAPFRDTDEEIIKNCGMPIVEIFAQQGEASFRAKETETLRYLLSKTPSVLSTGGGVFMTEYNRDLIAQNGVSVCLKANLGLLWNRVKHKNTRPLLQTANPYETLREIYNTRDPMYQLAKVIIKTNSRISVEKMVGRVIAALAAQTDTLEGASDEC